MPRWQSTVKNSAAAAYASETAFNLNTETQSIPADVRIIVTGGTFDKHYDAIKGELTFKRSHLPAILEQARVTVPVALEINQLIDSLQMLDEHRASVLADRKSVV